MSRLKNSALFVALSLGIFSSTSAFFGRVDFTPGDDSFSEAGLIRGVNATQIQCASTSGAVWASIESGDAECIRYWYAGLKPDNTSSALFFFSGDLLAGNKVLDQSYSLLSPSKMQPLVDVMSARLGVPYFFIARPGMYGSSGDHKQRRRASESRLISIAIDEIKKRHGITQISISGQSGGGHVVASLLTYRSDVVCAVPTSAVSAPRMRWIQKGWSSDATGYSDSYEPTENLKKERLNSALRVFVLGDPNDENVPWGTQKVLADKLKGIGANVEILQGEGRGPDRHGLTFSSALIGSLCSKGNTTEQILERASKGLKG